jgi:hypothetical protein
MRAVVNMVDGFVQQVVFSVVFGLALSTSLGLCNK